MSPIANVSASAAPATAAPLAGKVALVTGSSRGIGRDIALRLAQDGARVVINYTSDSSKLKAEEVSNLVTSQGGEAIVVRADVSKIQDIVRLFDTAIEHFGGIDIVVNNAAIFKGGAVADLTEEGYSEIFDINFKSVVFVSREAVKRLRDNGRIVNLSSIVTKNALAGLSLYSATKGAQEAFNRALAAEVAPRGITANAVSPGYTDTDMLPPAYHDAAVNSSLFKRVGRGDDISAVVAFLAREDARWVTGQNIVASGGVSFGL